MGWLAGAAIAVVLVALYASRLAGRLDRLRLRMEATGAALEVALTRRAASCRDVDGAGPVAAAAAAALAAGPAQRELAESGLTRAVRMAWGGEWDADLRAEVVAATERVRLARQFHNAAITALQRLRRRRLVRLLRLAGPPPPDYVEIDDRLPGV